MSTKPVFEVKSKKGGLKLSIWKNRTEKGTQFYSAKLQNRYYDEEKKEWVDSDYISEYDLPIVALIFQKAALHFVEMVDIEKRESSPISQINEMIKGELIRIAGNDKMESMLFRNNLLSEVMKKLGIGKAYKETDVKEKALIYAALIKEELVPDKEEKELEKPDLPY